MKVNIENTPTTPRIYVASLSDYNAGRLHGRWIDADRGAQHIWSEINAMLKESREVPAEEWAIHDYEGFAGLKVSESSDIDDVAEAADLLGEHGPVFGELLSHFGGLPSGMDDAKRWMQDEYHGSFSSVADYVEDFINDCYCDVMKVLPDFIRFHIDFAGIAHDMEISGDIITFEVDGEVHVFRGNV